MQPMPLKGGGGVSQEEIQNIGSEAPLVQLTEFFCRENHVAFFLTQESLDEHMTKVHGPKLKLYVCGPMTGIEGFNYEMFNIAAADLRESGYEVENPADSEAENTSGAPQAWDWYMRRAVTKLMLCNGIALLNGWENSRGAVIEVNLAHNLGYQIRHIDAWLTA